MSHIKLQTVVYDCQVSSRIPTITHNLPQLWVSGWVYEMNRQLAWLRRASCTSCEVHVPDHHHHRPHIYNFFCVTLRVHSAISVYSSKPAICNTFGQVDRATLKRLAIIIISDLIARYSIKRRASIALNRRDVVAFTCHSRQRINDGPSSLESTKAHRNTSQSSRYRAFQRVGDLAVCK